jgi:hypothetical protein
VAEKHPQVKAYVKNYNLGFEVPYAWQGEQKIYVPDFILLVDDGRGDDDPLHLVLEIKGYRQEDAKAKKEAMEVFWIPGVNRLGSFGRWAFAELKEVYKIESEFTAKAETGFRKMMEEVADNAWYPYKDGVTIGTIGSENGTIIMDEEHSLGARITLEQKEYQPYGITCGIYGNFVHTTWGSTQDEAVRTYENMKKEIGDALKYIEPDTVSQDEAVDYLADWIEKILDKY